MPEPLRTGAFGLTAGGSWGRAGVPWRTVVLVAWRRLVVELVASCRLVVVAGSVVVVTAAVVDVVAAAVTGVRGLPPEGSTTTTSPCMPRF